MPPTPRLGVLWTPEQAAAYLAPQGDARLLAYLARELRVPEPEPGRYDAAELIALHMALAPWLHQLGCR